ncbi:hypothetical protein H8R23_10710 [Flavobacterium sp. F-380]|uniref:Uncharacterized protein n=1 Tax=Flavobacterium kayseriense TaxID=2764714 RepID=A0ABR7J8U0_9FLAO|nr:hypothetical protein [Flavobacterium kayseriense]MBC5841877.1 hypothetical protein [Flavobacterium kayseriense]MBC5848406.1 hypothetical protein [Flavobacterium kayseriense]
MKLLINHPKTTKAAKVSVSYTFKYLFFLATIILLFTPKNIFGQESTAIDAKSSAVDSSDYKPFNIHMHLKNMHTWHGFVVTPSPMVATSLEYNSKNKKFVFGLWGGVGFSVDPITTNDGDRVNANYKELSIYTSYHITDKFFIEAVSHNNYTGVEERGDVLHYWSYKKTQGYNFVDLNFGYQVTNKTSLYLATILAGRSGDYEVQNDGSLKDSYTHYLEVKHKVWEKDNNSLTLFTGGAFSFLTDKTFYTDQKANIINVGAVYARTVKAGGFSFPIEMTAMWNPEKQKAVLQVDIALF